MERHLGVPSNRAWKLSGGRIILMSLPGKDKCRTIKGPKGTGCVRMRGTWKMRAISQVDALLK